jgi:hypothetical protein
MALDPALDPTRLFQAVGDAVTSARPLFTGDVFEAVEIPGIGRFAAIVIGHPCSMRGRNASIADKVPVAVVETHSYQARDRWSNGFFNRMALEGLPLEGNFHVARLDLFGLVLSKELFGSTRIACLSHPGINQLQQRLVFHMTRLAVPTSEFQKAFDHTYEEADLLEEWNADLVGNQNDSAEMFEQWIRDGEPSRQSMLEQPQSRAGVRREMREEIKRRNNSD